MKNMKENGKKEKDMEKVYIIMPKGINMKDGLKKNIYIYI
jgi:hypothetical protein